MQGYYTIDYTEQGKHKRVTGTLCFPRKQFPSWARDIVSAVTAMGATIDKFTISDCNSDPHIEIDATKPEIVSIIFG